LLGQELIDDGEERGQRFPGAGRRGNQNVLPGMDDGHRESLRLGEPFELGIEPLPNEREHEAEYLLLGVLLADTFNHSLPRDFVVKSHGIWFLD